MKARTFKSGSIAVMAAAVLLGVAEIGARLSGVVVASSFLWHEALYRDGMHSTVQGDIVPAQILSSAVLQLAAFIQVANK